MNNDIVNKVDGTVLYENSSGLNVSTATPTITLNDSATNYHKFDFYMSIGGMYSLIHCLMYSNPVTTTGHWATAMEDTRGQGTMSYYIQLQPQDSSNRIFKISTIEIDTRTKNGAWVMYANFANNSFLYLIIGYKK